jgi:hypothetical protein
VAGGAPKRLLEAGFGAAVPKRGVEAPELDAEVVAVFGKLKGGACPAEGGAPGDGSAGLGAPNMLEGA